MGKLKKLKPEIGPAALNVCHSKPADGLKIGTPVPDFVTGETQTVLFKDLKVGDFFTSLNIPEEVGTCKIVNKVLTGFVIIINDRSDIVGEGHFLWEGKVLLLSRGNDVSKYGWTSQLL